MTDTLVQKLITSPITDPYNDLRDFFRESDGSFVDKRPLPHSRLTTSCNPSENDVIFWGPTYQLINNIYRCETVISSPFSVSLKTQSTESKRSVQCDFSCCFFVPNPKNPDIGDFYIVPEGIEPDQEQCIFRNKEDIDPIYFDDAGNSYVRKEDALKVIEEAKKNVLSSNKLAPPDSYYYRAILTGEEGECPVSSVAVTNLLEGDEAVIRKIYQHKLYSDLKRSYIDPPDKTAGVNTLPPCTDGETIGCSASPPPRRYSGRRRLLSAGSAQRRQRLPVTIPTVKRPKISFLKAAGITGIIIAALFFINKDIVISK